MFGLKNSVKEIKKKKKSRFIEPVATLHYVNKELGGCHTTKENAYKQQFVDKMKDLLHNKPNPYDYGSRSIGYTYGQSDTIDKVIRLMPEILELHKQYKKAVEK